jgi:hypothetical protein
MKLTPKDVLTIRNSDEPQLVLAFRYDLCVEQISRIQRRLRWANIDDTGRVHRRRHSKAKLTDYLVLNVVLPRLAKGEPLDIIAADVGVAKNTISEIACNRTWRHLPRPAELANRHGYDGPEETR